LNTCRAGAFITTTCGRPALNISMQFVRKVKRTVEQITKELESDELPPVVLNKHCPICEFHEAAKRADAKVVNY
jgi:CRISPR/Cas system-associated exonuclease Cas4 (RecB family)